MTAALRATTIVAISNGSTVASRKQQRITVPPIENPVKASPYIEAKLVEIKAKYGARLLCHPDYVPNPRHSFNPEVYQAARAPYLAAIAIAAKFDREQNPAYIRAQNIRQTIGQGETE